MTSFSEAEIKKAVALETREATLEAGRERGTQLVLEGAGARKSSQRGLGRAFAQGDRASLAGMSKVLRQMWTRLGCGGDQWVMKKQNR